MWYVREMMSHLRQRSRWKVEFFSEEGKEGPESVFPLMALGDIVEERKEFMNPQSFTDTLLNYLGLENIASNTGDLVNYKQKYGEEIRSRSKKFYPDDVLYGRLRPYLNKSLSGRHQWRGQPRNLLRRVLCTSSQGESNPRPLPPCDASFSICPASCCNFADRYNIAPPPDR